MDYWYTHKTESMSALYTQIFKLLCFHVYGKTKHNKKIKDQVVLQMQMFINKSKTCLAQGI